MRICNQSTANVTQANINLKISSANDEQFSLASTWIYNEHIAIFIQENEFLQNDDQWSFVQLITKSFMFKSLDNPVASSITDLVSWLSEKNGSHSCLHLNVLAMGMWLHWQLGLNWVKTQQGFNVNLWLESSNFLTRNWPWKFHLQNDDHFGGHYRVYQVGIVSFSKVPKSQLSIKYL